MIVLTRAQADDLRYLVALYRISMGITRARAADGDSIRTGRTLARKGLVEPAARQFLNRAGTWVPSRRGLQYLEENFRVFDAFSVQALERAIRRLQL